MFGMMEALLSFLRRQVGLRTDAANAGGSVHAKIAEIRSYIAGVLMNAVNSRTAAKTTFKGSSTTTGTVLNVSGQGTLLCLRASGTSSGYSYDANVTITVDGIVFFAELMSKFTAPNVSFFHPWGDFNTTYYPANIEFKSSLRIDIARNSNLPTFEWVYTKE